MLAILIALMVLAGTALWQARRAMASATQARAAVTEEQRALREAYLAQAQAGRLSGLMGRKAAGLKAIAAAAAISPSVELRNEAIAHLALLDFEPTGVSWTNTPGLSRATIDPQFQRMLEGDKDGNIYIRPLSNPADSYSLRNTNGFVLRVEFAPDGRRVAVIYANTALTVWDLESRTPRFTRPGISWSGFNRQGTLLATAGNNRRLQVLDPATGEEKASFDLDAPAAFGVFDPTGDQLALVVGHSLEIWEWRVGRRREAWRLDHAAWSLDWRGNFIALGDEAGEVHLWNVVTGRTRPLQAHQDLVSHVAFNPRGDVLLTTSYDGSTRVWDPFTGRQLFSTSAGFGNTFSADDERVLFSTATGWGLWRVSRPEGYRRLDCASGPQPNVWHVNFSRDGQWLAGTKENGVWVFTNREGGPAWFQPGADMRAAYFLPDGTNLLTTSARQVDRWTIETSRLAGGPDFKLGNRRTTRIAGAARLEPGTLTADGRQFALPVSQTEIVLLELERNSEAARLTNAVRPGGLSFSPDNRWLAAGTFHGYGTRVWDLATLTPSLDLYEGNAGALFSPDGRYLVSAGSRFYQVFTPGTWTRVFRKPSESGSDLPNRAAFSHDAALLAVVQQRHRVELLLVNDWITAAALTPPDLQIVTWLAFSSDNRQLAVATTQDLVQLWDLEFLRQRLAQLGLDWIPGAEAPRTAASLAAFKVNPPTAREWSWYLPVSFGVLLALGGMLFIRRRQKRLLRAYMELDNLAGEQHQMLGQAQVEILHAQKMRALGTLAAGIAHDFNNLLSVVRLSNKLVAREAAAQPSILENVEEIEQAVQRGKAVVRSMLGYTRESPDTSKPFSVPELVEDTVALLTRQFLSGITLTLEVDKDAPLVTGSRNRLEQVLLNLLVNAAEAMNSQGKLEVGLRLNTILPAAQVLPPRSAPRHLELYVRDTGPGIAPEVLPRIFEPFFTTKNMGATHGTGLGLHLVYTIAQQDGLGIALDTAPGCGTTFRILIPVPPEPLPPPSA